MSNTVSVIDVRTIAPYERHAQIFGRLDALGAGPLSDEVRREVDKAWRAWRGTDAVYAR